MTEQCLGTFTTRTTPVAGWLITVGHPLIQQRFYAALDSTGALCWTDDPSIAEQFPLGEDADLFARMACPDEDWTVTRYAVIA